MIKKLWLIIFIAVAIYGFYLYEINSAAGKSAAENVFIVNQGDGAKIIANNLKQAGLIKSANFFNLYVWLNKKQAELLAGEYSLNQTMSIKKIVSAVTSGQAQSRERDITIIEGWNIKEIEKYLVDNKIISDDSFVKIANSEIRNLKLEIGKPQFLSDAPLTVNLEGFLFPDTYRIFKDATAEDIITKMLENFDKKLTAQMKDDIKKQAKTIYEIITMAALVEKEVRSAEDMKIVSGIFWDRIKNGQALESCASIAYILGEKKAQYSYEDTRIKSPYNTYLNRGLPPGSIANPGINAITAAIYPKYTDYNYFLSDPATGKTIYSKTLGEHNLNKAKYLK